jgi:hypothetical protein
MMEEQGLVLHPQLFAFTCGVVLGSVQLRAVLRGDDAIEGIAHMSHLPAAGAADEIVVGWDSFDLAVACDIPPTTLRPQLNVLLARPGLHTVLQLPYEVDFLVGETSDGRRRGRPLWLGNSLAQNPALPAPIDALVHHSFRPLSGSPPVSLDHAARYLRAFGYTVSVSGLCA